MNKNTLNKAVEACRNNTRDALQTVYDSLNQGQKNRLIKDDRIKNLFDLYEVNYNG